MYTRNKGQKRLYQIISHDAEWNMTNILRLSHILRLISRVFRLYVTQIVNK